MLAVFVFLAVVTNPGAASPAQAEPAPLAGPSARPAGGAAAAGQRAAATIVRYEFAGGVAPTPVQPEAAALDVLGLSAEERAGADAVLLRRARIIEDLVSTRLEQFVRLGTASAAGDTGDVLTQIGAMVGKAVSLNADGPLREQIDRALPEHARAEFARVLNEYWKAVLGQTGPARPKGGAIEVRLGALGREVEAAFQRLLGSGALIKTYLTRELTLTPEQDARVAELAAEFARTTNGSPTKGQETAFFFRLMSYLTPEQQAKVVATLRSGDLGRPRMTGDKPAQNSEPGGPPATTPSEKPAASPDGPTKPRQSPNKP